MMRKRFSALIVFAFFGLVINACASSGGPAPTEVCDNIPRDLGNQTKAIRTLKTTEFTFEQSLETLQITGVQKATYYSCNGNLGYLVVNTSRRNYLYENVPRELWENFKNAYSIDNFFNRNLKFNTIYSY